MNFIGKIFVVFIFIMSIVFMTLSAVVYSTHQDWEQKAQQAQQSLTDARADASRKESEFNRMKSELDAQRLASLQQVSKLETERDRLTNLTTNLQRQVDEMSTQVTEATAMVAATQKSNNLTTEENQQLRSDIRVSLQKTDEAYNKALAATDELHDTRRQLEIAAEQRQQLLEETGRMTSVMREEGLDPNTSVDDVTPRIDGFVQSVSRRGGHILVQVSIGQDDGLRKGHTLEVFQGAKYLGRVKVLTAEPDRAIGVVDPRYQVGRIQEGDRVATRLNLG